MNIIDYVTPQWESVNEISQRAGMADLRAIAKLLKTAINAGEVEAEGKTRAKKYRSKTHMMPFERGPL